MTSILDAVLGLANSLAWCGDIRGFLKHGPRYWRILRKMERRAYERNAG